MNAQEALVEALVEAGKPLHRVSLDLDGNETPWAAAIIKALPKGWGVKEGGDFTKRAQADADRLAEALEPFEGEGFHGLDAALAKHRELTT